MNEQVTHAGCRVSLATARGSLANQLVDTRCGVRGHLSRHSSSRPRLAYSGTPVSLSLVYLSLSRARAGSFSLSLPFCLSLFISLRLTGAERADAPWHERPQGGETEGHLPSLGIT